LLEHSSTVNRNTLIQQIFFSRINGAK
jgi:hypothetical protein